MLGGGVTFDNIKNSYPGKFGDRFGIFYEGVSEINKKQNSAVLIQDFLTDEKLLIFINKWLANRELHKKSKHFPLTFFV